MDRNSLGDSPEVIKLFETMEQNRLYVEKARMEEIVAHIDELLAAFYQMEKELADLRQQAAGECAPILDEGTEAVQEAKTVVERVKDTIRDTAGRAAKGHNKMMASNLFMADNNDKGDDDLCFTVISVFPVQTRTRTASA